MRRTIIELLYIALGMVVAVIVAALAIWAVPPLRDTIWTITACAVGIELVLQFGPLRRAWRMDRMNHRKVPSGE